MGGTTLALYCLFSGLARRTLHVEYSLVSHAD
jgi:hypothetical protein